MTTIAKTSDEVRRLRESGKLLASILSEVARAVAPGVTAIQLDSLARDLIKKNGATPAFFGYIPSPSQPPYPAAACVSINNNVVHSIPDNTILKEGDIVGIDLGIKYSGMITDMAMTVSVGTIDDSADRLLSATRAALYAGIAAARGGKKVGDISYAIQKEAKRADFSIVKELGGHGVGRGLHEQPFIPNFGKANTGAPLKRGMVLAIEPILNEGSAEIKNNKDGYTIETADGSRSAHFEHTILITDGGAEILTRLDAEA